MPRARGIICIFLFFGLPSLPIVSGIPIVATENSPADVVVPSYTVAADSSIDSLSVEKNVENVEDIATKMATDGDKKSKLWQIGAALHPLVEKYTVGADYKIDEKYGVPYDVKGSRAHAIMLESIGILSGKELEGILRCLEEIEGLWRAGTFEVKVEQEDCHTAIEQYITERLSGTDVAEAGKKIHTGRSRNDQSMTMMRLFAKAECERTIEYFFAEF